MLNRLASRIRPAVALGLLSLGFVSTLSAQTATPDLSGKTDDSIRQVLRVVARNQLKQFGPLKDGDYTPVTTLAAAEAARKPEGIGWSYPWGVTLYGVIRSTDATGDKEMLDWALEHNRAIGRYYAWLENLRPQVPSADWTAFIRDNKKVKTGGLLRLGNLDACGAMGVQYIEGMLRHPAQTIPEQKAVVARVADWIAVKQERLPDGTFWRPKSTNVSKFMEPGTLWIDDLYMGCPYLVRWAAYTGETKHLHDAAQNVINMAARLQDKDGVWFHAYFEKEKKHNPWKWGRANGWAMVATVEILSALPDGHPDRAALLDILRRHIEGIKPLQPESGVWRQVLDRKDLWEETSCTAMFAYSIARAVNRGWIDASNMAVARKGFAGICAGYITPDGGVNGTCEGTNVGLDVEFYANRKRPDNDLHGRGVVLLAGAEILAGKK
jgi:unsaturated rhamnogalacturonyl hydrolase